MSVTPRRAELLARLEGTIRTVAARSVLMTDTVAGLVGLHSTDLKCLDLLLLSGATTAGELARHTGLTTGATTAVIDRLERAGFVRRLRDPGDRRRVLVETRPSRVKQIEPLYQRLAEATGKLNAGYDARQLAVVVDYLSGAIDLVAEHVTWLQTQPPLRRDAVGGPRRSRRPEPRPEQALAGAARREGPPTRGRTVRRSRH
jgi:DNA-binding MarR family transcriptional regulator